MKFQCFHAIKFSSAKPAVDREAGVIRNVAIMSIGAAKGHGVLVDGTTLSQVRDSAKDSFTNGMPAVFNPSTFDHGPAGIAGFVPNDSLSLDEANGVLRGDLKMLKSYSGAEYIYELAENQPDTFGLSLEFDGDPEEVDGIMLSRCTKVYKVTLVDEPAANPTGLFRALDDSGKPAEKKAKAMTDEEMKQFKAAMGEIVAPLATSLAEVKAGYSELSGKFTKLAEKKADDADDDDPDCDGMSSEAVAGERMSAGVSDTDTKLVQNRKVNKYRKNKGKPATLGDLETVVARQLTNIFKTAGGRSVATSASREGTGTKSRFDLRVETLIAAGLSKPAAIATAVRTSKDHGNDYQEYSEAKGVKPNRMAFAKK